MTTVRGRPPLYMGCSVEGCDKKHSAKSFCKSHYRSSINRGDPTLFGQRELGRKWLNSDGYVMVFVDGRSISEHRYVMEQVAGRRLLTHEHVHHRNGDRTDNRPENLELWTTRQPPGQRVEDKVTYAREILALYGHLY